MLFYQIHWVWRCSNMRWSFSVFSEVLFFYSCEKVLTRSQHTHYHQYIPPNISQHTHWNKLEIVIQFVNSMFSLLQVLLVFYFIKKIFISLSSWRWFYYTLYIIKVRLKCLIFLTLLITYIIENTLRIMWSTKLFFKYYNSLLAIG